MPQLEHKNMAFEVKALDDSGTFEGYGAAFGNIDSWGDVIEPGAFKKSLAAHKKGGTMPALLWQHDSRAPLGIWAGVKEDAHGLLVQGKLLKDEVRQAGEAYALLKAGALSGMSIGYLTRDYSVDQKTGVRTLKQVDLLEISLVTFPANEQARVTGVKSGGDIRTIRDFEAFLRDVGGFSANEAKCIAARGFKARDERENSAELAAIIKKITTHNLKGF